MAQHRILVPIDGSAFSRQIFPHMQCFLPPADNLIILLRVGEPPEGHVGHPARVASDNPGLPMYESTQDVIGMAHPIFASQERESMEAEYKREMQPVIQELEDAGYTVLDFVRFGDPGEEIVQFIEVNDIDLVAMTTHWRKGLNRLIFGSVAQYVTQHATTPIMVVRPNEHE